MTWFLEQPVHISTCFSFIYRPRRLPTLELLEVIKEKWKRRGEMLPGWEVGAARLKHGAEEHELQRRESEHRVGMRDDPAEAPQSRRFRPAQFRFMGMISQR